MPIFTKGQTLPTKSVRFNLTDDVYINLRELTSSELLHYKSLDNTGNVDLIFDMIARCAVDDASKPLFIDAADVQANLNVGLSTLVEMQLAVMKLSGLEQPKN